MEDQAALREVGSRVLSEHGYRVTAASDPEEAIVAWTAQGGEIDLLLTDVVMPNGSGPGLAQALRSSKRSLPVLYLSGHPRRELSDWGVGDTIQVIAKPFAVDVLLHRVREALDAAAAT